MKFVPRFTTFVLAPLLTAATAMAGAIDYGTISSAVAQVLEEGHYSQQQVNPDLSRLFLTAYLENLDPDHLYFTKADVDPIVSGHAATLGKDVLMGRLGPAFEIFDLYKKRVQERVDKISAFLKAGQFDFTGNGRAEISRDHAPWPADTAEADQLWQNRILGEVLDEKLNGTPIPDCVKIVLNRYEQVRSDLVQESRRDAMAILLNSLAAAYDPHSEYLRKEDLEDLDSDMRLSMVGIGVVIEGDGRYAKIVSLLPGSPAESDGRLKPNDRIVGVAKGDGSYVDTAGMSVDRVLALIRGKKGTRIRLKVFSPHGADANERKEVALVSRNIELIDDEAKAEIVEKTRQDGAEERLGWITLPSFYGDPEQPNGRSVTRDVRNLVVRLKKENVSGIVLDMRNNPGGELEEAVGVGGLFLGQMPIVQEKDRSGKIYVSKAEDRELYDGPLVVVADHMTASAAELLSCALQDYGRAVVVGGHRSTYGKGSVQTVVELGDVIEGVRASDSAQLGALQLTIAKFYRVNGQSTQLRGLTADIQLPSPEDLPLEGEASMKNTLQYDETKPVHIAMKAFNHTLPIEQLKERSIARVAADQEFHYLSDDIERETKKDEDNYVSLNEAARRAEMDEEKARDKQRDAERKLRPASPELVAHINPGDPRAKKAELVQYKPAASQNSDAAKQPDEIRSETLNILSDLVHFTSTNVETANRLVESSPQKAATTTKVP